jgi:methylthioribose-1-phosphate isomerase
MISALDWIGDAPTGFLRLLDQTRLPEEHVHLDCHDVPTLWQAIKRLSVRGAPAIGIAAAYGCVLAARAGGPGLGPGADHLATSRPTAVNLFWALDRMRRVPSPTPQALLQEARAIHEEDRAMCRAIGEHAFAALQQISAWNPSGDRRILTHCNAGALATGGIGTATAPIYVAHERGLRPRVFADETRPLLQGGRLTAYELARAGVEVTLICDSMAAQVMREGRVAAVITGADRIAANGDAANKIGTYGLAVLAQHHRVPFLVAAPSTTFDLTCPDALSIPIEQRDAAEVTHPLGRCAAPRGVSVYNPAFDVTPAALITALVTERGVIQPVSREAVAQHLA